MRLTQNRRSLPIRLASLALFAVVGVAALQGTASAASPTISAYASSGWWAGAAIYDAANLKNGVNPTGTLTFSLYSPLDTSCTGTPMFVSHKPVAGNGYYTSDSFTTNAAGTYRWIARYSGDAANTPTATVCSDANQDVWVAKRQISLVGAASEVSGNGTISNTATLSKGSGPAGPTGSITFNLYGPNNLICAGAAIYTSTRVVSGNGTYGSGSFLPTAPGKYQWRLTYTGDANNTAAVTTCSDTLNDVTVGGTPTAALSVSASSAATAGGAISVSWSGLTNPSSSDWVGLYVVGAPGWSVTSWSYATSASGSINLAVPAGAPPANYEVRLRTAKSGVVVIS